MTPRAGEPLSTAVSSVVAQYETLRAAALGDVLPLEGRSGLMVFLRRGMFGWARRLSDATTQRQPAAASRSDPRKPGEQNAIVYVFASLATKVDDRRTP
ncbi:MAG: hypothetical protein WAK69_18330 [Rhodoplanes sp.]